jgi:hypothetical protein
MPHLSISKILMPPPVAYNSYYSKSELLFTWRKPKRPLTWSKQASKEHGIHEREK